MVKLKNGADLLLAFGVRFDDRVTGKFEEFCKHGTIVHVDIDASELNKNRRAHLPVVGDIKDALVRLNRMAAKRSIAKKNTAWHEQIAEWSRSAVRLRGHRRSRRERSHEGSSQRSGRPVHHSADGHRDAV
jgi:acetolactate synthase-1/2/3 large subunit